jgi:hypothetical protein
MWAVIIVYAARTIATIVVTAFAKIPFNLDLILMRPY